MKRLTTERKKRNMSMSDLAFELRIQPAQLSKIENGIQKPYAPSTRKLEEFFNMSIDKLLKDVNQEVD